MEKTKKGSGGIGKILGLILLLIVLSLVAYGLINLFGGFAG